jgi:hypothetical protein
LSLRPGINRRDCFRGQVSTGEIVSKASYQQEIMPQRSGFKIKNLLVQTTTKVKEGYATGKIFKQLPGLRAPFLVYTVDRVTSSQH